MHWYGSTIRALIAKLFPVSSRAAQYAGPTQTMPILQQAGMI